MFKRNICFLLLLLVATKATAQDYFVFLGDPHKVEVTDEYFVDLVGVPKDILIMDSGYALELIYNVSDALYPSYLSSLKQVKIFDTVSLNKLPPYLIEGEIFVIAAKLNGKFVVIHTGTLVSEDDVEYVCSSDEIPLTRIGKQLTYNKVKTLPNCNKPIELFALQTYFETAGQKDFEPFTFEQLKKF